MSRTIQELNDGYFAQGAVAMQIAICEWLMFSGQAAAAASALSVPLPTVDEAIARAEKIAAEGKS